MAQDLAKLVVKLEAQTAQYTQKLDSVNKKMAGFERRQKASLKRVGAGFKALGAAILGIGITRFIRKIAQATKAQDQAVAQLRQGLKTTDNAAGFTLGQLTKYASELQAVTTFGDEKLIAAQAQLISFTSIAGDEFKRTLAIAGDLSIRFGTDLKSSVIQLGKALNDPIANLSALSRSGIQFSTAQKTLIKSLVETGRMAEAQRVILGELETQFGGSAKAARDTFGGAIEGLNNAFGDLLESKGGLKGAQASIEDLTDILSDPDTAAAMDKFVTGILKLATVPISGFKAFVGLVEDFAAASFGPAIGDIDRLTEKLEKNRIRLARLDLDFFRAGLSDAQKQETAALLKKNVALQAQIDLTRDLFTVPTEAPTPSDGGGGPVDPLGGIAPPVDLEAQWDKAVARGKASLKSFESALKDFDVVLAEQLDITQNVDAIDSFLRTESEAIKHEYDKRLEDLREAEENKLITLEEFQERRRGLEERHTTDQAESKARQLAGEKGYLDQIVALNVAGSKKLNRVIKAAALVNAIVKGFEALQNAWALPWPANIPAVALTAAVTAANIAGIKGAAHGGLTDVPEDGTFLLKRGERVFTPRQNTDFTQFIEGRGAAPVGGGEANISFNIQALDVDGVQELFENQRGKLMSMIGEVLNETGRPALT